MSPLEVFIYNHVVSINLSLIDEDLKLFPVDVSCWMELKARVGLARRIDKEEHR